MATPQRILTVPEGRGSCRAVLEHGPYGFGRGSAGASPSRGSGRRSKRRGVLLLIVLALLAMFALLGLSFVVITGQARRGSEALSKADQYADPPELLLNDAAAQVLRGPNNPMSTMGAHGLLEDIYGTGATFTISSGSDAAAAICGGQLISLNATGFTSLANRVGGVLTMFDGPAAGRSTRIVRCDPTTAPPTLQIMAFDGVPSANVVAQAVANGASGLINGRPFNGTGVGFDANGTALNDSLGRPLALEPNAPENLAAPGGANEDYDAPDYQNMALALQDAATAQVPIPSFHRPDLINYWYNRLLTNPAEVLGTGYDWPSGWTDDQKWRAILQPLKLDADNKLKYAPTSPADFAYRIAALKSRITLRPLRDFHPNFNGSNPYSSPDISAMTAAQLADYWELGGSWGAGAARLWDVDNDGDGIPDSIWIDLGAEVRSTRDGRLYKPLFAILCLDLDGRLNLNAHGSTAQLETAYYPTSEGGSDASGPYAVPPDKDGNLTGSAALRRGEGNGPAEINLTKVMSTANATAVMQGATGLDGRYGEVGVAAAPQAGVTGTADNLTKIKFFDYPDNYLDVFTSGNLDTSKLTSFGNPPDLWGRGAFGLDYRGQPYYSRPAAGWWSNEVTNAPYKLNLSRKVPRPAARVASAVDNPFTPAELERLLRSYDMDAGLLAQRLVTLAPGLVGLRTQVTTDSNDVPTPARPLPSARGVSVPGAQSVVDLLRGVLENNDVSNVNAEIAKMLSWELLANRRMDVNRPLGLGGMFDSSGAPLEPGELEAAWNGLFPNVTVNVSFDLSNGRSLTTSDLNGDGTVDWKDQNILARHLYARQLYVLMLLLMDSGYLQPVSGETLSPSDQQELTTRRIAQWAINVVDFRDPDSIMTPFEYDVNPFNGWDVDGDLSTVESTTDRRVVWGCESPELLITETLAFHDRRVADTSWDSTGAKRTDDKNSDDTPDDVDLDQPLIPQGSAFFELYCPRNPNNVVAPNDLYTYDAATSKWYLDLGRLAPEKKDSSGTVLIPKYPVWRAVVSESRIKSANNNVLARANNAQHSTSLEPRLQYNEKLNASGVDINRGLTLSLLWGKSTTDVPDVQIERVIWFAALAPTVDYADYQRIYYNHGSATGIACSTYAVVGPRPLTTIGSTSTLGTPSGHSIQLDVTNSTVAIEDNDGTVRYPNTTTTIKPPLPIIVAHDPPSGWTNTANTAPTGIGLSISEPIPGVDTYYPEPTKANSNNKDAVEAYVKMDGTEATATLDHPLDSASGKPLMDDGILATGTTTNYKTLFLQRLANPLMPYQNDPTAANYNPYLTIDWSPIDLTVLNGSDRKPDPWPPSGKSWTFAWDTLADGTTTADANPDADPDYKLPEATGLIKDGVRFATRQRGPATYDGKANLWAFLTSDAAKTVNQTTASGVNFRHNLGSTVQFGASGGVAGQTLGYVNQGYGIPWSSDTAVHKPAAPADYIGTPCYVTEAGPPDKVQALPFPWLTWNNRPYSSPLELLLVPASHPARLCWEFALANSSDPYNYDPSAATIISYPFTHLLNFFHAANAGGSTAASHFYRILEYLQVPSRFVGSETWLNPGTSFFGNLSDANTVLLRPPFNFVSNYRDPGKVNINTITSAAVWNALLNDFGGPSFGQLVDSRRGYGGSTGNLWQPVLDYPKHPVYPTSFANPFRSSGCAGLVPVVNYPGDPLSDPPVPPKADILRVRPVNGTLLRAGFPDPTNPDGCNFPLFGMASSLDINNTDRNPLFRYQALERLANLVSTRSNVYAVWITVGYFEVAAGTVDAAHPDGYYLGRELGTDTGEIQRHRAFYIFDRSIPVGFQRGQDLNVMNAVLLKRFIE